MRLFRALLTLVLLLPLTPQITPTYAEEQQVSPLKQAHAHNDYLHDRPLFDALDHGFNSVEADIFLVGDKLLVAHTKQEQQANRTLESLYLQPLRERIRAGGGRVFPGDASFHLFIDIKSDAEPTYAALSKVLAQYSDIISLIHDGKVQPKAVNVTVSGNRPIETMTAQTDRYAGIDGRLGDLNSDAPVHLMPVISDNWKNHFQWKGKGPIPEAEQQKLTSIIQQVHAKGRRIRFWGTPDNRAMWRVLRDSGVDMINTDDLPGLEKFLREPS